jgi:hypothetical protein
MLQRDDSTGSAAATGALSDSDASVRATPRLRAKARCPRDMMCYECECRMQCIVCIVCRECECV